MGTRRPLLVAIVSALLGMIPAGISAQTPQQGTLTGRVTDAPTGQPLANAQIAIVGTNLGAQTNSDGQYTIRSIPPGAFQIRALRGAVPRTRHARHRERTAAQDRTPPRARRAGRRGCRLDPAGRHTLLSFRTRPAHVMSLASAASVPGVRRLIDPTRAGQEALRSATMGWEVRADATMEEWSFRWLAHRTALRHRHVWQEPELPEEADRGEVALRHWQRDADLLSADHVERAQAGQEVAPALALPARRDQQPLLRTHARVVPIG